MKKKIAIIGSGIAGLTLGNLLKKNSQISFKIYEREDGLVVKEGYGIQLSVNCISILRDLDFDLIDKKKMFHPQKLNFFSIANNKICDLDLTKFNTKNNKYTTLRRSVLVEFLREKLFKENLKFNKEIKKISEMKDKILINFTDNTNDLVDYLFVCDGIFSNTKKIIEKKPPLPEFSKAFAIRSIVESSDVTEIDSHNISLFMGSKSHVVTYPINQKGELNVVCIIRSNEKNIDDPKDFLEKKILNQSKKLKNLFKNQLEVWPIYVNEKFFKSPNKKIFYLGDSLHAMLPSMAQGAAQSIEGAYELYSLLNKNIKNFEDIYYDTRFKKIKLIKKRSKINYFAFHLSNNFFKKIRNFMLRKLVKNEKFLKSYLGKVYN